MKILSLPVLALMLCGTLLISGCIRQTDPSQAGFSSGLANLLDGTYDQRVQEREATLTAAQRDQAISQQQASLAFAEARRLENEVAQTRTRLYGVDQETQSLQRRLDTARQENRASEAEIQGLQRRLDGANRQVASARTKTPSDQGEVVRLEAEIATIEREIDEIETQMNVLLGLP